MIYRLKYFFWSTLLYIEVIKSWALTSPERTVVILYHKPPNVVTSHANEDVEGRTNVYQDVCSMRGYCGEKNERNGSNNCQANPTWPQAPDLSFPRVTGIRSRLHAVGRLDADTTGALLLTNDGRLVHQITNPTIDTAHAKIPKTYRAVIMGHYENDDDIFMPLRSTGVDIGTKYGGRTLPVEELCILSHPTRTTTAVSITIIEGKNRQVRRMFHAIGSGVIQLHRISIGNRIELGELQEGQWRILSDAEVQHHLSYTPRLLIEASASHLSTKKRRKKSALVIPTESTKKAALSKRPKSRKTRRGV